MREVFDKCQEMEAKRLKFFKEVMFSLHKCINIAEKERYISLLKCVDIDTCRRNLLLLIPYDCFCFPIFSLPPIYEEFHHTISNADHMKDLKWWSNNHGVNMAMNWPTFEVSHPVNGAVGLCVMG